MNSMNSITVIILAVFLLFKPGVHAADDHRKKQLSSVTVVGRVFCATCFHRKFSTKSYFLSGSWVSVECRNTQKTLTGKGETDSHGLFRIKLPSEKEIETCSVNLLRSSDVACSVPFIKNTSRVAIKSKINNDYVYSAGSLSFRPSKKPAFCKKPQKVKDSEAEDDFPFPFPFPFPPISPISFPFPPIPPISFPPIWGLPPIPFWPPFPDVPAPPPDPAPAPVVPPPNPVSPPSLPLFPPPPILSPPSTPPPSSPLLFRPTSTSVP